jgi:hypothetical protein
VLEPPGLPFLYDSKALLALSEKISAEMFSASVADSRRIRSGLIGHGVSFRRRLGFKPNGEMILLFPLIPSAS